MRKANICDALFNTGIDSKGIGINLNNIINGNTRITAEVMKTSREKIVVESQKNDGQNP